jgi:hypothetical protein
MLTKLVSGQLQLTCTFSRLLPAQGVYTPPIDRRRALSLVGLQGWEHIEKSLRLSPHQEVEVLEQNIKPPAGSGMCRKVAAQVWHGGGPGTPPRLCRWNAAQERVGYRPLHA